MKKLIVVLLIAICCIAGYVYASTVTTQDGKNFNVTNDAGFTAVMTNDQINAKVAQYNSLYQADSVGYLSDQETLLTWSSVQQMAQNAEASWQANQVNQVNAS